MTQTLRAKVVTQELDGRRVKFVITDPSEDRDRDVIDPKGAKLDHYLANPVLLWGHDAQVPPIGKAETVQTFDDRIEATFTFLDPSEYGDDPHEHVKFADMVYRMCRDGHVLGNVEDRRVGISLQRRNIRVSYRATVSARIGKCGRINRQRRPAGLHR